MNLNSSNNFLIHDKDSLEQPLPDLSDPTLLNDNLSLLSTVGQEIYEIESSTSTSIYEFIQPKIKQPTPQHHLPRTPSPKKEKELNLTDYFKSIQL